MWSEDTPTVIFPRRKIGYFKEGYEASFLVLKGDPIRNFLATTEIVRKFKQGYELLPRNASAEAEPIQHGIWIGHVTVVDVTTGEELRDRTVVLEKDRIAAMLRDEAAVPSGASRVIDAAGKYLIPGLWDMHVHGAVHDAAVQAHGAYLPLYVANGVTAVRDMFEPPNVSQLRTELASKKCRCPGLCLRAP